MTEFDLAIYEIDLYGFTIVEEVMTQEAVSYTHLTLPTNREV